MGKATKFLSNDRALRDGFTLHPKDEEVLAATNAAAEGPLPEHLAAILKVGGFMPPPSVEEHGVALNLYHQIMVSFAYQFFTLEPDAAQLVATWRCDQRYSWRLVAQAFFDKFGAPWEPPWNQIGGMALCRVAAHLAGGDFMVAPWN